MSYVPKLQIMDIKGDYIDFTDYPEVSLAVVGSEDFHWNPLDPQGMPCDDWAAVFAAAFANAAGFWGGQSTENCLHKWLAQLYRKYDTENGKYPSLIDLTQYVSYLGNTIRARYQERDAHFRILNRLENICLSFRKTIDCSRGYALGALLGMHVVYDLRKLRPSSQCFFQEIYLTQAIEYRMFHGERGGMLRNLVILDEVKRLAPRVKEQNQGAISNISNIAAFSREFGIGLAMGECHPAALAESVKGCCHTRLVFNQSRGRDVKDSSDLLGLDIEQESEIQRLPRGEVIVRVAERIKRPFAVRVLA